MPSTRTRFREAEDRDRARGQEAEDAYYERARTFDPYAEANRAAQGQYRSFMRDLQRSIGDLRGRQVGMGRLDTGFATEDGDRLISGALEDLNDSIAERSMTAAGMDLSRIQDIGRYGERTSGRYLDLLASRYDREQLEEEQRRRRRGGIGALIGAGVGAVGGSFIPGIGTAIGARLGGALGGGVGQYL